MVYGDNDNMEAYASFEVLKYAHGEFRIPCPDRLVFLQSKQTQKGLEKCIVVTSQN